MGQEACFHAFPSFSRKRELNRLVVGGIDTKFFRPAGVRLGLGVEANIGFRTSVRSDESTSSEGVPLLGTDSSREIAWVSDVNLLSSLLRSLSLARTSVVSSTPISCAAHVLYYVLLVSVELRYRV